MDAMAASIAADEKHNLYAAVSHQFRQLRKEKEKEREASPDIGKLEHHKRELTEERNSYQRESEFLS